MNAAQLQTLLALVPYIAKVAEEGGRTYVMFKEKVALDDLLTRVAAAKTDWPELTFAPKD